MEKATDRRNQQPEPVRLWKEPFIWIMIFVFGFILVVGTVILVTILTKMGMETLQEQTFAIRLMQLTFAIAIGLAMIVLGSILSWLGVKENTHMQVETRGVVAKLATAGAGPVFVICGTIVICFCLQKEFRISSSEPIPAIQFDKSMGPQ